MQDNWQMQQRRTVIPNVANRFRKGLDNDDLDIIINEPIQEPEESVTNELTQAIKKLELKTLNYLNTKIRTDQMVANNRHRNA